MASTGNRAILHKVDPNYTGIGKLELASRPIPEALPGKVVIHLLLRPINSTDLTSPLSRHGRPVSTPGSEGYGIVHAIGDGVTKVKPGQRVVPFVWESAIESGDGSWQEYVCVRESMLTLVPDSVSNEVAAQFVLNPWTAVGLMRDLHVPEGDFMLQTAAGSMLGRLVIQLAKHKGIKIINVVRREEQKEELKALGADEVICSTTEDVVARVKEITSNKLVYGALDCVGGGMTKIVTGCVRRKGTVFLYGVLSGTEATINIYDLLRQVKIKGWLVMNYWDSVEHRDAFISEAWRLFEAKVFQLSPCKRFELSDVEEALKDVGKGGGGTKVLLETKL
ncbi:hypothetical protein SELMODRAFT_428449 [Selaginella moellendorffii]|uniref:Enoyl reductase (ER) domain-containing protein n=1 Tax=Selaginella moellendorffii TaxID=88036 RepID=D8T2W1_SELML|nr:enoyl-[acyl-carrier-protein] reductase, mitochondrial [Selaginella moellendorffii]EFJ08916.1 hypothetical protein SELMODRAFT_428449 [Selaginella moellendorffii]|eukprot:XP_002989903.1 enoyl-[acyl-carrier-protein] reductase, mitochondrial [Selaginella moellendorffii]